MRRTQVLDVGEALDWLAPLTPPVASLGAYLPAVISHSQDLIGEWLQLGPYRLLPHWESDTPIHDIRHDVCDLNGWREVRMHEERHRDHSLGPLSSTICSSEIPIDLVQKLLRECRILLIEDEHTMAMSRPVADMAVDALEQICEVLSQERSITLLWRISRHNRRERHSTVSVREVEYGLCECQLGLRHRQKFTEASVFASPVAQDQAFEGMVAIVSRERCR